MCGYYQPPRCSSNNTEQINITDNTASRSARRHHLNTVRNDDADMSGPRDVGFNESTHQRSELLGLGKVPGGEEAQLCRDREQLVFVGEIAGIGKTREDILSRQAGIVAEDFVLRLAPCQEFWNELNSETRSAYHRLACQGQPRCAQTAA